MEQFMTWEMLGDYAMFVLAGILYSSRNKKRMDNKESTNEGMEYHGLFLLLVIVNLRAGTFGTWDIVMYFINAILISLNANGLADINSKGDASNENK